MYVVLDSSKAETVVRTDDFSTNLQLNLQTPESPDGSGWECALVRLDTFYSYNNIITGVNDEIVYTVAAIDYTITIPAGNYSVEEIQQKISQTLTANGHVVADLTLTPNYNTNRVEIFIGASITNVDFSPAGGEIYLLFGLSATQTTLTSGSYIADNIADINRGVNMLQLHMDCVNSYFGGSRSDILWSYGPEVPPGSAIVVEPKQRLYVPVQPNQQLGVVRVFTTDQQGRSVNFGGELFSVVVHFRRAK